MSAEVWLGAVSPGGLALPAAHPTPSQLYGPRGVFFDTQWFVVADSGNHRVLIWRRMPNNDGEPAEIVVGQQDFTSEGPKLLHLPTGVGIFDGKLVVADAWHHRVLVWNRVPEKNGTAPDYAIGQQDLGSVEPNRGGRPTAATLYWPYGCAWLDGWFWVADMGNRRVLGWQGMPGSGRPADVVLGQSSPVCGEENRGAPVCAGSFRWPHAIAGNRNSLYVADAGNHRVLGWTPSPLRDAEATLVLGQPDFHSNAEFPYAKQSARKLRFPYSLALDGDRLAVADTANNRVLLWNSAPASGCSLDADEVIGQDDFSANGENHWKAVTRDSLCWPYGVWLSGNRLAVADSGNNRVLIWDLAQESAPAEPVSTAIAAP